MPEQTKPALPKGEEDLQERINGFNKELLPLLGKFELGLAAIPKIVQGGTLAADPVIVSARKHENTRGASNPEASAPADNKLDNPDA